MVSVMATRDFLGYLPLHPESFQPCCLLLRQRHPSLRVSGSSSVGPSTPSAAQTWTCQMPSGLPPPTCSNSLLLPVIRNPR